MPQAETPLPESDERRCPRAEAEQVVSTGHVIAGDGLIKIEHRCGAGGTAFLFVRKPFA